MSPDSRPLRWIFASGVVLLLALFADGSALAVAGHFRLSHGEPLNDRRVTPGAIFHVTLSTLCQPGYAARARHVTSAQKDNVYAEYGITHHATNEYEIDHLIPLELGGDNSIANLWPQFNDRPRGYLNSKDLLENRLHALVCAHRLGLGTAQSQIATDWVATYHHYLGAWPRGGATPTLPTTSLAPVTTGTTSRSGVSITSLIRVVAPGRSETLSAYSRRPHDTCTLDVTLPSGRHSTAAGLGTTSTDSHGVATWVWRIGSRTGSGTALVTVACEAGVAHGTFVVT